MLRSRDVRNHHCSSCCLTDKRRRRTLYTSLSRSTTVCHTPTSEPLYQGSPHSPSLPTTGFALHRTSGIESSPASSCHARLDRALPTAMAAASGRAPSACALLLFLLLVVGAAAAAAVVVDANRGEQEQLSAVSPSPWRSPAPAPSPVSFIGKTPPPSRTWWMPYTLRFCVHVLNPVTNNDTASSSLRINRRRLLQTAGARAGRGARCRRGGTCAGGRAGPAAPAATACRRAPPGTTTSAPATPPSPPAAAAPSALDVRMGEGGRRARRLSSCLVYRALAVYYPM